MNWGIFIFILVLIFSGGGVLWYFVGQPWWDKSSCNKKKADTTKHVLTWVYDDKTSNCNVGTCESKYEKAQDGASCILKPDPCITKTKNATIKTWKKDTKTDECVADTCVNKTDKPVGATCVPSKKTPYKQISDDQCHLETSDDNSCPVATYKTVKNKTQCENLCDKTSGCTAVSYDKQSCSIFIGVPSSKSCTSTDTSHHYKCYKKIIQ